RPRRGCASSRRSWPTRPRGTTRAAPRRAPSGTRGPSASWRTCTPVGRRWRGERARTTLRASMQRILALATLFAALLAAPAHAALTAAPFAPVLAPSAACLGATGLPGELTLGGRSGVDLWSAGADGPSRVTTVPVS